MGRGDGASGSEAILYGRAPRVAALPSEPTFAPTETPEEWTHHDFKPWPSRLGTDNSLFEGVTFDKGGSFSGTYDWFARVAALPKSWKAPAPPPISSLLTHQTAIETARFGSDSVRKSAFPAEPIIAKDRRDWACPVLIWDEEGGWLASEDYQVSATYIEAVKQLIGPNWSENAYYWELVEPASSRAVLVCRLNRSDLVLGGVFAEARRDF